ncbi:hypothetical protein FNAPI_12078 [Fusarium napiforme]|uniref:Uncharacterized protein n=1 Tax=Fusarium napiforme TaxID=42672 RepID=A0A8H5MPL4_9HYPO|nr:hypothetical protein FNAPI_12078 [Fusarium napiforme]
MSSNSRFKILGRRTPPPYRLPNPAFFLIWYALTSLSLILPATWRNTGTDGWQLLTTALKAEMAKICSVLPQSDREFKQELAYFTTVQRCIETVNLTPRLMGACTSKLVSGPTIVHQEYGLLEENSWD